MSEWTQTRITRDEKAEPVEFITITDGGVYYIGDGWCEVVPGSWGYSETQYRFRMNDGTIAEVRAGTIYGSARELAGEWLKHYRENRKPYNERRDNTSQRGK